MKLFLTFPGAKFKLNRDSSCFNGWDSNKWCNAHVFRSNELMPSWGPKGMEELKYKDLTDLEEYQLQVKINATQL